MTYVRILHCLVSSTTCGRYLRMVIPLDAYTKGCKYTSSNDALFRANHAPHNKIIGRARLLLKVGFQVHAKRASSISNPVQISCTPISGDVWSSTCVMYEKLINKWLTFSEQALHRGHLLGPIEKLFCRWSQLGTFLFRAIHRNNLHSLMDTGVSIMLWITCGSLGNLLLL